MRLVATDAECERPGESTRGLSLADAAHRFPCDVVFQLCVGIGKRDSGGERFFGEGFHEGEGEGSLLGFVEFGAVVGEVEDVDGDFAFGVDEGDFDVAVFVGEAEGDLAEQAGGVLGGDLEQCAVAG